MVFTNKICPQIRAYIHLKRYENILKLAEEVKVSRSQVYRILKSPLIHGHKWEKKPRGGRPTIMSDRTKAKILREVKKLRLQEPNWTVKRLQELTGVYSVSLRTLSRFLNNSGYRYRQTRRKGLLTVGDYTKRVKFAKEKIKENTDGTLWTTGIAFYLDGVGFTYKRNPKAQANAPKGRIWRRMCEGLDMGCTSRGSKCGTGGKYVKLIVAISYKEGVVCAVPYEKMNGAYFASFIKDKFENIFQESQKQSRKFVQDGDPSQNSVLARNQMDISNATVFPIPPRSPDVNPIENVFNLVRKKLDQDAIKYNITMETMEEFQARVINTLQSTDKDIIDRTIESMDKRMHLIVKANGKRLKY